MYSNFELYGDLDKCIAQARELRREYVAQLLRRGAESLAEVARKAGQHLAHDLKPNRHCSQNGSF